MASIIRNLKLTPLGLFGILACKNIDNTKHFRRAGGGGKEGLYSCDRERTPVFREYSRLISDNSR